MLLPSNLQTGRVEARFVLEILDGPDPDDEPEVIPAEGVVAFTANIPYWPAGAAEMIIVKTEKVVPLIDGWVTLPDSPPPGPGENPGFKLFATDDPDYGAVDWKWTATPRLRNSAGVKLLDAVPPIEFQVPSGGTVDLARVAKAPSTPPVGIVQSESNAAAAASFARDAAQSAERAIAVAAALHDRADQGEFKGDTGPGYTIPSLQLTAKDDTPIVTFAPIDIWSGPPTIPGSAGWFREKRVDAGERAPGEQQGDGKPLDIDGSSYFRYPTLLAASDWANNSGRIAISNIKPGGDAQYAYELFNLEFVTNSDVVEIMVNVGTTKGSIGTVLVDGKRISERDIRHNMTMGDGAGIKFTFPTAKQRTIRIYGLNSGSGRFGGVAVGAGYTITKPTVRPARKFAFIGDSFVNGTDAVAITETFVWRLADLMGADEVLQMGVGGTGFGAGDAATRFDKRVAAVLAYNPDVIVFAGGRNDSAGAALQKAVSDTLALTGRDKEVYLISTASDASQSAVNDALAAGAKERGVPFIRADVDAFPREDAVHLTHAGHQLFADELFSKIVSFKPLPELDDAIVAGQVQAGAKTQNAIIASLGAEISTKPLPARPAKPLVVFSFDDGWIRDMTVVKPILDEKGIKASFAIVSSYVGSSPTKRLNWQQVRQLENEGHEIMNHSFSHPRINGTDIATLEQQINESQDIFVANGFRPTGFVWPFAVASVEAKRLARSRFKYALGGAGSRTQPLGTFDISRESLNGATSLDSLKSKVDQAKANNQLLIFLTHAEETELNDVGIENLRQTIDYVKASGIEIVTANDAFNQVGNLLDTETTIIDGAGKLHAPAAAEAWGRIVWGGGGISSTLPPSSFVGGGITYNTISAASNKDWPEASSGNVITQRLNTTAESYTLQTFFSATNKMYLRRGADLNTWQAWTLPAAPAAAQTLFLIDAGLATYLNEPASSYARGKTLQRVISPGAISPSGGAGIVETTRMAAGYCYQEFVAHTFGTIWRRSVDSADAWLPWKQMTLV